MVNTSLMRRLGKAAASVHSRSRTIGVTTPQGLGDAVRCMDDRGNAQAPHRFGRKTPKEQACPPIQKP